MRENVKLGQRAQSPMTKQLASDLCFKNQEKFEGEENEN